jgi:hypothetical protein
VVTLTIDKVTPEEAFALLCKTHPRYKEFWSDEHMETMGRRVGKGYKPVIVIDEDGVLCDGALALGGVFEHGQPVQCAVYRCSVEDWKKGIYNGKGTTPSLPHGWQDRNIKLANCP